MERCEKCIHNAACQLWINHGKILYDDFAYSTDDCPFFSDRGWGQYIKLEDLQKFPIREDHCDKEHGNENFIFGIETVLEYAEHLPTYDVVPKTEVERLEAEKETLELSVKDLRFRNKVLQKCNEGLAKNCGDLELQVEEAIAFRKTQVEQIFADFGKLRCTNDEDYREFAELRKKYERE